MVYQFSSKKDDIRLSAGFVEENQSLPRVLIKLRESSLFCMLTLINSRRDILSTLQFTDAMISSVKWIKSVSSCLWIEKSTQCRPLRSRSSPVGGELKTKQNYSFNATLSLAEQSLILLFHHQTNLFKQRNASVSRGLESLSEVSNLFFLCSFCSGRSRYKNRTFSPQEASTQLTGM